ncbi:unnamed protein product [Closterium sp. NIES-65]|nr:unnamed protein product [Closterium sp. NIES-65]
MKHHGGRRAAARALSPHRVKTDQAVSPLDSFPQLSALIAAFLLSLVPPRAARALRPQRVTRTVLVSRRVAMEDAEARRSRLRSMRESAAKQQAASPGAPNAFRRPPPHSPPPTSLRRLSVELTSMEVVVVGGRCPMKPSPPLLSPLNPCQLLSNPPQNIVNTPKHSRNVVITSMGGGWMAGFAGVEWSLPHYTPLKPAQNPFNHFQLLSTNPFQRFQPLHQVVITSMEGGWPVAGGG